jgi:hypothetical protein
VPYEPDVPPKETVPPVPKSHAQHGHGQSHGSWQSAHSRSWTTEPSGHRIAGQLCAGHFPEPWQGLVMPPGCKPFDYLVALQRHQEQVAATPAVWMPWNYRVALACLAKGSTSSATEPAAPG